MQGYKNALAPNKVHSAGDGLGLFQVITGYTFSIVATAEAVPADGEFFRELRIGGGFSQKVFT